MIAAQSSESESDSESEIKAGDAMLLKMIASHFSQVKVKVKVKMKVKLSGGCNVVENYRSPVKAGQMKAS